jgi:phage repressor protein C with HTH and peptisase S24 domain
MMNETIKSRRKELKLTQLKVAEYIGVSKATVSQWEKGDTSPNGKNLIKLLDVLQTNYKELIEGLVPVSGSTNQGQSSSGIYTISDEVKEVRNINELPLSYNKLDIDAPSNYQSNAELIGGMEPWSSRTELPDYEVEIPFFTEIELAAGNGMIDAQEHNGFKLRFARSTLKKQGVDAANAACVKVSGNSMEPVLPDGSTIGVDIAKTDIVDGKMFALDHDGMLRVKTLYKVPGGGIRLKSFNSDEHPDEIYDKDESKLIRIIGKVFWYSVLL